MNKLELSIVLTNRIIELTEQKNISIRELARKAEIRQSTLNSIINDGKIPTLTTLMSIAKGLDMNVLELLDVPEINKKKPVTIK